MMNSIAIQSKQNSKDRPESVSSCSNSDVAEAEDDQMYIFECRHTSEHLVGVCRSYGRFLLFEFDNDRETFVIHNCSCQSNVWEADLYPMYSVREPNSTDDVIFVRNQFTCKIEQYFFNPKSCDFEQIFNSELVYDANLTTGFTILVSDIHGNDDGKVQIQRSLKGGIEKLENRFGRLVTIPQFIVKTAMTVNGEKSNDPDVALENKEHSDILKLIPKFTFSNSAFRVVHAFSTKSYEYKSFRFNYLTGDFYTVTLEGCSNPNHLCESQIKPRYSVYSPVLKTYVVHALNMKNSCQEQFAFDENTLEFFQVNEPELVYDPQNDSNGSLVLFVHKDLVVLEDYEYTLRKEQFSEEEGKYVKMPSMEIKTFANQLKEKLGQEDTADVPAAPQKAIENDPAEEEKKKKEMIEHYTRLGLLPGEKPATSISKAERARKKKQKKLMREEMKSIFSKEEMERFDCDPGFFNAWLGSIGVENTASLTSCSQPSEAAGSSSNVDLEKENDTDEEHDEASASHYWNTIFPPI